MDLRVQIIKKMPDFEIEVDFSCRSSQLVVLLGPSGSGKTTIIRILAGLDKPDHGRISFGETVWVDTAHNIFLPARQREVGYVFQEFILFPHLTVKGNVSFAAVDKGIVDRFINLLGVEHLAARKPNQISGGERQRVAIAQALARNPKVLLLDEPFSALDIMTRTKLRDDLNNLKKQLSVPVIHVTHDLDEAEYLADMVFPVKRGKFASDWLAGCLKSHTGNEQVTDAVTSFPGKCSSSRNEKIIRLHNRLSRKAV